MHIGKYNGDTCIYVINKPWGLEFHTLIKLIGKLLKISKRRIRYFGLKDASSTSILYLIMPCTINKIYDKRFKILCDRGIRIVPLGSIKKLGKNHEIHLGNLFLIDVETYNKLKLDLSNITIPNYYGYQRFGFRRINHILGLHILKRDYKRFIDILFHSRYKWFRRDYVSYLNEILDRYHRIKIDPILNIEMTIFKEYKKGSDPATIIRRLPGWYKSFLVNAFQSYIFNLVLKERIELGYPITYCVKGDYCFINGHIYRASHDYSGVPMIPLIGYSYQLKNAGVTDISIRRILKEFDITNKDFYQPENGIKVFGGFRKTALKLISPLRIYRVDENIVRILFGIERGGYATIVLRELFKPSSPAEQGY